MITDREIAIMIVRASIRYSNEFLIEVGLLFAALLLFTFLIVSTNSFLLLLGVVCVVYPTLCYRRFIAVKNLANFFAINLTLFK